jgi:hypothetical protein
MARPLLGFLVGLQAKRLHVDRVDGHVVPASAATGVPLGLGVQSQLEDR